MSGLPNGWVSAPLKSLLSSDGIFSDGDWIESKDQDPNGSIRLLQLADIGDGYFVDKSSRFVNEEKFVALNCTELKTGDVLIARMPDPLGRACLLPAMPQPCITVVDVAVFRTGKEGASNKWLMNAINSPQLRAFMETNSSGTTRKRIARGKLADMELPVPPINEQKRIADKLDAVLARVDGCRDRLDRIPVILKRFRQTVLAAATSGKLTEDWRISNSEATGQYVSSEIYNELPDLPSSWCYERLGKLLLGLKYGTSQKCEYEKKGKPVFRIPNIGDGVLINDNMKYAELPEKEYQQLALQAGDILMIRSNGSVSLVGKTALVSSDFVGYAYAGYLIRLRPNEEVQPGYLNHVLASMWLRQQIETPARSTSGINNINSEEVRNLLIPLPPVDEQAEIVRRVEALFACADRLGARYTVARTQVEKITPATLAKAFRGELVPQDPNDEPASVLLERIRAQRSDQAVNKPNRSRKATA